MTRLLTIAAVASAALLSSAASATILTFDIDTTQPNSSIPMDRTYGNRVTATTIGVQSYGVGSEGFTPNVTASYAPTTASLYRWNDAFGDLTNVYENEDDGDTLLELSLTADAGYAVSLYGFDMGGYAHQDYTIPDLKIVDGAGNVLFDSPNFLVQGTDDGTDHSVLDFSAAPLTASSLSILVDLTGLGGNSDNIGIDNVRFGQGLPATAAVPEPATWAMMIGGFGLVGGAARRSRRIPRLA